MKTLDRLTPPPSLPMEKIPFPEVQRRTLDNGIPVYFVQFGTQEIVELNLVFPGGRSFEPQAAAASFTASMLQEGTENYTGLEFARKLNEVGAFISCEAGFEAAGIHLSSLTKHLNKTVELVAELALRPIFPAEEFSKLQGRTIERLDIEEQKTSYRARLEFNRLLHGIDTPYGRTADKEDVRRLELQLLSDFHARNYAMANGFFVASGRFPEAALLDELNRQFGSAKLVDEGRKVNLSESKARFPNEIYPKGLHYFEMKESMQATVRVGHKGFQRSHPDQHRMQVVNTLLGGFFGSRLMKNIREDKGYTYGIGSAWVSMKYDGTFVVQTDVGNEYIQSTLDEIKKEIRLLIEKGVTSDELELVKNYMLGRSASARETPTQIASLIESHLVNGIPFNDLDDRFEAIRNVQPEEVQSLAAQYLNPDELLEVVAGKMEPTE